MTEQVTVWFPAFQKTSHTLNKIAFTLFGRFEVRWYGILITLGIILAFTYIGWRGKKNEGILFDNVIDVGLLTVVLGIVGARVYYVLTSLDEYHSFYDVIAIWNGGIAVYGSIIGGCTGILIMCAVKKINWRKFFDATAPAVLFAQALGRWGNFFNGEAYGSRITDTTKYYFFLKELDLPSGEGTFFHFFRMGLIPNDYSRYTMVFVHPTFLYESIWNLVGFIWINLFYKHKKFDGQIALLYFTWYGFGRMFIEGFRTDSLYIGGNIRISQLVGLLCFAVGTVLLIVFGIKSRKQAAVCVGELTVIEDQADETTTEETTEDPVTEDSTMENPAMEDSTTESAEDPTDPQPPVE